jgi:hypothetical protein
MSTTRRWALFGMMAVCAACTKHKPVVDAAASATASAPTPPPSTSVAAAPSASAEPEVQHDCPKNSTGKGSFSHPCEAKGAERMVVLEWNHKSDSKGSPWFKVTSKAPKTLLYGHLAVYFYDKAGKQIDVKEQVDGEEGTRPYHTCSGKVFAGGLNPGEKARYTFSCVKKSDMPEGTAAMEAEATIVGFADAAIKKDEFFWKNADLAPNKRPKGGVKKK